MPKKKFSETEVGKFLTKIGSSIGGILPEKGFLGVLRQLITKDKQLAPKDKETALKLLEIDIIEIQEITKRWQYDMVSDSWLSKNTRPLALLFLTFTTMVFIALNSSTNMVIDKTWIDLLKTLLITVYVAYFGSRGIEKVKNIGK